MITSVKEGAAAAHGLPRALAAPAFTYPGAEAPDFEISGPPDHLTVTLKEIAFTGDFGTSDQLPYVVWEGSKDLAVDGANNVDASGIRLDVPAGTVAGVQLTPASHTSYAASGGTAQIQYTVSSGQNPFVMQGFVGQSTLDEYTPLATWTWDSPPDSPRNGEAYFQLKLLQQ